MMSNSIFERLRKFSRQYSQLVDNTIQFNNNIKLLTTHEILKQERYRNPKCLSSYGYKFYSQNQEDGLIHEIFKRIGTTSKFFIEFGVGDGLENNTLALLFEGWHGLWIEGNKESFDKIISGFKKVIDADALRVINAHINIQNIDSIISSNMEENEIDLISIDIDGNDYHIFMAILSINPRVIVMEYNSKFPPHISFCTTYNAGHRWDGSDNYGSSLKFLEQHLTEKHYSLVGCDISGSNAFFVRDDLLKDKFMKPYTSEMHYESFRSSLGLNTSGHRASYDTLSQLF
ncbi:MAG: FkbM family methyltransferase [Saprospiraceae bacterium]